MSEENVEPCAPGDVSLQRRDRAAYLALHDDDFEVVSSRDWPEPGAHGPEAAWDLYIGSFDLFERGMPLEDAKLVDAGADKVLVHNRYDVRGAGSGAEVEFDYSFVATVRQERFIACSGSQTAPTPS
jgi:ketosteroid isomerase-like protein